MDERVLVTGGSGYFGGDLVRSLTAGGDRVRVLDLADRDDRHESVEFVHGDVRDPQALARACEGVSTVYHAVAVVPLARDREAFFSVNRDGTRRLLEACRAARVAKVVHVSSSAVFGVPPRNPVDDSVEPRPAEDYGLAKLQAETVCREFAAGGLDVTIVRPRTIVGPGRLGIMQIVFEWIREGYNIPVLGRGDNLYQFVHSDDLASACLLAGKRPGPAVYNVGAETFGTMRETLEGLAAHAGTGSRVRSLPAGPAVLAMRLSGWLRLTPLAPYHWLMYGRSMYFDVAPAKRDLGWSARYSNVEAFCQAYDWYLANREAALAASGASHHRSAVAQGILAIVKRLV